MDIITKIYKSTKFSDSKAQFDDFHELLTSVPKSDEEYRLAFNCAAADRKILRTHSSADFKDLFINSVKESALHDKALELEKVRDTMSLEAILDSFREAMKDLKDKTTDKTEISVINTEKEVRNLLSRLDSLEGGHTARSAEGSLHGMGSNSGGGASDSERSRSQSGRDDRGRSRSRDRSAGSGRDRADRGSSYVSRRRDEHSGAGYHSDGGGSRSSRDSRSSRVSFTNSRERGGVQFRSLPNDRRPDDRGSNDRSRSRERSSQRGSQRPRTPDASRQGQQRGRSQTRRDTPTPYNSDSDRRSRNDSARAGSRTPSPRDRGHSSPGNASSRSSTRSESPSLYNSNRGFYDRPQRSYDNRASDSRRRTPPSHYYPAAGTRTRADSRRPGRDGGRLDSRRY